MKTGRNDPCPCGSGKKYKRCCQGEPPSPVPRDLSPAELVQARRRAFEEGNFAFIYDTYHPDSYFREQFPDREAYIRHGSSSLADDFRIVDCLILKEEVGEGEARVTFYLDSRYRGERGESFELARFLMTPLGWRYHSSQKLSREEFPGRIEQIDWADFEKVVDKVFF